MAKRRDDDSLWRRQKLTAMSVYSIPAPETGQVDVSDAGLPGFGLRISAKGKTSYRRGGVVKVAKGTRSFYMMYRPKAGPRRGKLSRLTLGKLTDQFTLGAAHDKARDIMHDIEHKGADPKRDRDNAKVAPTMSDLCEKYEQEHLPRKRSSSQRDDKGIIRKHIKPALGDSMIADVEFDDIDSLHRKLEPTPYRANRVLALLSKMFALSIKWKMRADNPCKGVERYQEEGRERYLSPDERGRLLVAMQKAGEDEKNAARKAEIEQTVNMLRLAMLTGCRIGEARTATWSQFDQEQGLWVKPSTHTKQKKEHRVWLSAPARALLGELLKAKASDTYLFPSRGGEGPQTDYKRTWAAIRTAAALSDLRVHDLRHNFASEGASVGLSLPMIGALLGHTNPATTAKYAHLMADPLKDAAEKIGARLGNAPR